MATVHETDSPDEEGDEDSADSFLNPAAARVLAAERSLGEDRMREIDNLVDAVHAAREQEAAWMRSDPRGVPSEIKLKEEGLRAAIAERERLEGEIARRRGDVHEEPSADKLPDAAPRPTGVTRHSSAAPVRENILTPVIRRAQAQCENPRDPNEVWPVLVRMANDEAPPLLAAVPEGIKYQKNGKDEYLNKAALAKRLRRQK